MRKRTPHAVVPAKVRDSGRHHQPEPVVPILVFVPCAVDELANQIDAEAFASNNIPLSSLLEGASGSAGNAGGALSLPQALARAASAARPGSGSRSLRGSDPGSDRPSSGFCQEEIGSRCSCPSPRTMWLAEALEQVARRGRSRGSPGAGPWHAEQELRLAVALRGRGSPWQVP